MKLHFKVVCIESLIGHFMFDVVPYKTLKSTLIAKSFSKEA